MNLSKATDVTGPSREYPINALCEAIAITAMHGGRFSDGANVFVEVHYGGRQAGAGPSIPVCRSDGAAVSSRR